MTVCHKNSGITTCRRVQQGFRTQIADLEDELRNCMGNSDGVSKDLLQLYKVIKIREEGNLKSAQKQLEEKMCEQQSHMRSTFLRCVIYYSNHFIEQSGGPLSQM
jgi:hypothetical protein